jgi:hypothetical protein
MPRARPRSLGGRTAVSMATPVAACIAPPMPWRTRPPSRKAAFGLKVNSAQAAI